MALQDHFRPPLSLRRHWHGFHSSWATYISSDLNRRLPQGYFAEPNVKFGIEIDVAAFEDAWPERAERPGERRAGATAVWTVPPPTQWVPVSMLEETVEVLLFNQEAGPTLAGAIELVSPANKDRAGHRDAFVSKCAAYVQGGVGLVIVDVVTDRRANLHEELLARLQAQSDVQLAADLYAAAYRPISRDDRPGLDIWQEPLSVGGALPSLPLWLCEGLCVPVDLDGTYERTCREQRIGVGAG